MAYHLFLLPSQLLIQINPCIASYSMILYSFLYSLNSPRSPHCAYKTYSVYPCTRVPMYPCSWEHTTSLLGRHSLFIGSPPYLHWGLTLSPLGTNWSRDPMKTVMNNYAEIVKIIRILFAYMRKIVYICIEIQ